MHIKFLPHSTGSGRNAVEYLLGEEDHKGEIRAGVEVWRGNPKLTGELIDSLQTVHRYTSGVVAFEPTDQPTDAELDRVIDDLESTAFAGLDKSQYDFCAVVHRESNGGVHIHFIAARQELTSGKAMNIAPPGWQRLFDPLRDALNHEHGWARPDDPSRSRLVQQGKTKPTWKKGVDNRVVVTDYLIELVANGVVADRRGVLEALGQLGEITRSTADSVSVKLEGSSKAIKLKGLLYRDDFSPSLIGKVAAAAASRPAGRAEPDASAAAAAREQLAAAVGRRAEYNKSRYPAPQRGADRAAPDNAEASAVADALASLGQPLPGVADADQRERVELVDSEAVAARSDELPGDHRADDRAVLQEPSGPAAVQKVVPVGQQINLTKVSYGRIFEPGFKKSGAWPGVKPGTSLSGLPNLSSLVVDAQWPGASKFLQGAPRPDVERSGGAGPRTVRREGRSNHPNSETGEVKNDRARTLANTAIDKARSAARTAVQAVERCTAAAGRAAGAVGAACFGIDRAMPAIKNNQAQEIERFKREINLVEFAQSLGYELIKKESSKSSAVMRSGGDKIIVATNKADGHGIYFSVGDDDDHGSLIDFAQKRLRLSLGLLRKELRTWLPGAARPSPKRKPPPERPERLQAVSKGRAQLAVQWARLKPYSGSYLTQERRITQATIEAFGVRQDERGNAVFKHRDSAGNVCGWEVKNAGFTGFSGGGEKGLMTAKIDGESLSRIVLVEASIDAMSYAQMHHEPGTMYVSLGGEIKPEQLARLKAAQAANPGAVTISAFDNDPAGDAMAHQVRQNAPQGVQIMREVPTAGKDWNDALRAKWAMPKI